MPAGFSSQSIDQESLEVQGQPPRSPQRSEDMPFIPPEPNWLFSNRSQWYPQGQATDYATATIRFTVPGDYTTVASGVEDVESPTRVATVRSGARRLRSSPNSRSDISA